MAKPKFFTYEDIEKGNFFIRKQLKTKKPEVRLSPLQQAIVEALKNGPQSQKQLAAKIGTLYLGYVSTVLQALNSLGMVESKFCSCCDTTKVFGLSKRYLKANNIKYS